MNKSFAVALQSYAKQFHARTNDLPGNVVASPLGAWMLVASVAASLNLEGHDKLKVQLESALHMTLEDAEKSYKELLSGYPELNYVSKAWSASDVSDFPAIGQWLEVNKLIPSVKGIPTQEVMDNWADDNTHGLIKEFPVTLNNRVILIIANIIYSKLEWSAPFELAEAVGSMEHWNVKNVLHSNKTRQVSFLKDSSEDIYAVYTAKTDDNYNQRVNLLMCLTNDKTDEQLLEVAYNPSLLPFKPNFDDMSIYNTKLLNLVEERRATTPEYFDTYLPSWEASTTHELLENHALGFYPLVEALAIDAKDEIEAEVKQVAVAKFNKEGFEAAALTTMVMARAAAAMPTMYQQKRFELTFASNFAFVSFQKNVPVFSGVIREAKEAE